VAYGSHLSGNKETSITQDKDLHWWYCVHWMLDMEDVKC